MHRSSESVAALAGALAKAQAELVNPEKSLTATIRGGRLGEAERTFRYAPLSSGLDIVRKALGQHEIATVQSTSIDQAAGVVNLTTMIAHASGEWIASDWPVCAVADMASPHRMGAALTYARRYALFTLVGIAGEDDLDTPDLHKESPPKPSSPAPVSDAASRFPVPPRASGNGHARQAGKAPPPPVLPPAQSAVVRDRLLIAVADLQSGESAAAWARDALAAKNTLTASDAKIVEAAFEHKLTEFSGSATSDEQSDAAVVGTYRLPSSKTARRRVFSTANNPQGSTRASCPCPSPGAIEAASTCCLLPGSLASSAAASPRTPTTCASCSRARSAEKSVTSSRCRSAVGTTAQPIAPATSSPGGRPPASTRSRSPASSGSNRAVMGVVPLLRIEGRNRTQANGILVVVRGMLIDLAPSAELFHTPADHERTSHLDQGCEDGIVCSVRVQNMELPSEDVSLGLRVSRLVSPLGMVG